MSSETLYSILAEYGCFPNVDGYSEIPVPKELIGDIGYVIGRNGYYFKKITEASGASFIWFNKNTSVVEIYCLDTPFNMTSGSFHCADDVIGATPEDVDEELMDEVSEHLEIARSKIYERFERCSAELGTMYSGKPRPTTLADYMRDL